MVLLLQDPQFISKFRDHLSQGVDASVSRHVFLFSGEEDWQLNSLSEILQGYEADTLWIGNHEAPEPYPNSTIKNAFHWLGSEKQVVVFDANKEFDVDAFAAISGIVMGGGFFIILLPPENQWSKTYSSRFGRRLIESITATDKLIIIRQNDDAINFYCNKPQKDNASNFTTPFVTADQQNAVEIIEKQAVGQSNNAVVLISDRGRGKSAALGIVAARLLKQGFKRIAITAPRLRSTDILFKHITEILPDANCSRGSVELGDSRIQFYSPDDLILNNISAELLLIDEAAAIPVPLLSTFLERYPQCVFATTVHGYEGTGRGFSLRFNKILNKKNPDWIKLHMHSPVRWPENDILEKWMFDLLCLDAEVIGSNGFPDISDVHCESQALTKDQLVSNSALLKEVFALLVLAHYRTRPSDLKKLLDDDDLSAFVTLQNKHVIAVALVIQEGSFSDSLSTSVYRGERRPSGHLLAQALTYHCGVEHAATHKYSRIMRIAVHPELQQKGIGTTLLNFIIQHEKSKGCDAIGTSFGMNTSLLSFWEKSAFNVVRIGFTREQTSGEHAAIMLLPITDKGEKVHQQACDQFIKKIPYWFDDVLIDIPSEIKNKFNFDKEKALHFSSDDLKELESFIFYSRHYELCIAVLNKLVESKLDITKQESFPDDFRKILLGKVVDKKDWKTLAKDMSLVGKNDARKLFHQAIRYLTNEQ